MQTAGQTALGKLGKSPRKRRLDRKPAGTAPAAQPAKPAVNLKTLDQAARHRNVDQLLGYEGARQRRAVLLRPPCLAAEVGQKSLDPHQFQNGDEGARCARPSVYARSRASGPPLVERRTSNPIAARARTRLHSSVIAVSQHMMTGRRRKRPSLRRDGTLAAAILQEAQERSRKTGKGNGGKNRSLWTIRSHA